MAIYRNDINEQRMYENKTYLDKSIRSLSEREVKWLQGYLASNNNIKFSSVGSTNRHEELVKQLVSFEDFKSIVSDAQSKMSYRFMPEQHFEWLIDNLRGQIFTLNILYLDYGYNSFDQNTTNLMNEIYSFFDRKENQIHVDGKIEVLNNIEQRWYVIFEKSNYSKWLNEKNIEQIEWTRDYLKKGSLYNNLVRDRALPKTIRSHILASLDLIDYPVFNEAKNSYVNHVSTDRKERIIDKMKRAWSQQKYRDAGKTKKPYHLPLTKQTQARLEKMAKVKNLSQTAMLDILINSVYDLEFIDVDGNELF